MKVRTNRHRTLANMAHNNKTTWYIAPFLAHAKKVMERNQRIKAQLLKAFPE
jgi:hypothetical protein